VSGVEGSGVEGGAAGPAVTGVEGCGRVLPSRVEGGAASPALTRLERRAFEAFTTAVVAPAPPLPPVRATDAAEAFAATLAASPPLNRLGLRAGMLAAGVAARRTPHHPALKPLRALAHFHYYGDPRVMELLGYDADAVVARARR